MTPTLTPERITRSGFDALVAQIVAAIATPKVNGDHVFNILRDQFGFENPKHTPYWGDGSTVWEHPIITRHNRECGSDRILSHAFFTLYAQIADYRIADGAHADYSRGYMQFVCGRVGNTFDLGREFDVIEDPPAIPDDSQGVLFA